jgi:chromate transporter
MRDDVLPAATAGSLREVFLVFLKLGLTSFGGPIAHLGYFRDELVVRRRWIDEAGYLDLVALCQFLPGPASSQVGFALGVLRGNGLRGGLAAWLAFTAPSAFILLAFALGAAAVTGPAAAGFLHGLKLVAVAVVAQAIWGMAKSLTPDRERAAIAFVAVAIVVFIGGSVGQIAAIIMGALVGIWLCPANGAVPPGRLIFPVSRCVAGDSADRGARDRSSGRGALRCVLSVGRPCLRRRPCRPAAPASRSGRSRLGHR